MHGQKIQLYQLMIKFKAIKIDENNNTATMCAQCLHIFKL